MPPLLCVVAAVAAFFSSTSAHPSPLLGPVFPAPSNFSTNGRTLSMTKDLSNVLAKALRDGHTPFGNFTPNATSLSVAVTSAKEKEPLFDFHFMSPLLDKKAGGTSHVDSESVYRI